MSHHRQVRCCTKMEEGRSGGAERKREIVTRTSQSERDVHLRSAAAWVFLACEVLVGLVKLRLHLGIGEVASVAVVDDVVPDRNVDRLAPLARVRRAEAQVQAFEALLGADFVGEALGNLGGADDLGFIGFRAATLRDAVGVDVGVAFVGVDVVVVRLVRRSSDGEASENGKGELHRLE